MENTYAITESVNLNENLTNTILAYIMEKCHSFDDICSMVISMADHYLELLQPDDCGFVAFHDFWLESCSCDPKIYQEIENAVIAAKNEIEKAK